MNCDPTSLMQAARCLECIPPGMQSGVRSYLLCQWANKPGGGGCTDPIVDAWLARMVAGGVLPADMPTAAQTLAVCQFCHSLRVAGIENMFSMLNPIINVGTPNRIHTISFPLIGAAMINFGFVAADLNDDGLIGDGVSKYFDTSFNPSKDYFNDSGGMTVYAVSLAIGLTAHIELGIDDSVINSTRFFIQTFDNSFFDGYDGIYGLSTPVWGLIKDTPAFYSANRISNTDHRAYQASTGIAFHTVMTDFVTDTTLDAVPSGAVYFMATDDVGGGNIAVFFVDKRVSFAAIHEGLDPNQAQDLFDAVQALRIALGGGTAP